MAHDPRRIPRIAEPEARRRARLTDPGAIQAMQANAVDKIPEVRCPICKAKVEIDTDRHGRLVAYDRQTWRLHAHQEATVGEGDKPADPVELPPPAKPTPPVKPSKLSREDVLYILEADESSSALAARFGVGASYIQWIWTGAKMRIEGYDYEDGRARRKSRGGARGRKAQREVIGNRALMQRLQV
jgi:hypothetical protein